MQKISIPEVIAAADRNLVTHFSWIHLRIPGTYVAAKEDVVLVDSGLPCDTFNAVCQSRLKGDHASERIQTIMRHFVEVNRPYSWWVTPGAEPENLGELLLAAGLVQAETELAMVADLGVIHSELIAPDELQIQRVSTSKQLQDFAQIVAANWTPPDRDVLRFYTRAAQALLSPDVPLWLYVGYLQDIPVVTSQLTIGGGVVGLYNVCTLEEHRRKGFGTALTLYPLREAQAQGYQIAILQASEGGARIYKRIGFQDFGQVTEYKPE